MKNILLFLFALVALSSCPFPKPDNGGGGDGRIVVDPPSPSPSPDPVPPSCYQAKVKDCVGELTDPPSHDCGGVVVDEGGDSIPQINIPRAIKEWKPEYTNTVFESTRDKHSLAGSVIKDGRLRDSELKMFGCEGYKNATDNERRVFFTHFLGVLGIEESGYRANLDHGECSNGRLWNPDNYPSKWPLARKEKAAAVAKGASRCWLSSGMFQMSRSTVERKPYSCKFKTSGQNALHDPNDSITCALQVLNTQIKNCGGLFCNREEHKKYAYFGPMRRKPQIDKMAGNFKKRLRDMPFCDPNYRSTDGAGSRARHGQQHANSRCSSIVDIERTRARRVAGNQENDVSDNEGEENSVKQ